MGTFRQTIEIGDPEVLRYEAVEALVDTGASYTILPASLLRRLGVTPFTRRRFRLGDNRVATRELGETRIKMHDEIITRIVVFGEEGVVLLGADTLEGFGLVVDPIGQRLVPVEGLMMRVLADEGEHIAKRRLP
ncbi:MAG: retroviral-like aspartic protease family protein [Chloroflexi bacterium]|nr:retroviral-like aspartic protease family protein [Chloroflexota bacterium]